MNTQKILKECGFSENEATLYTALLKYAEATAFSLAKETGIARTTAYHTLDSLMHQKYVSSWKKNNVVYYSAESPNRLVKMQQEKEAKMRSIVPELMDIRGHGMLVPAAKLYTGIDGVKFVWEDILETLEQENNRELHAFSNLDMMKVLPKYFPNWLKRREKLKIYSYLITASSSGPKDPGLVTNAYRETRMLPSHSPINGTLDIYGKKTAFFSFKENEIYAIIIESPAIATMLRNLFISTWELLGAK
ncbi:MAG: transcriptional regulator [Candidatus Taylorbacteria bacterium]|nr:transcriptional regulator [Candidatus Taylorbacteria bacterium]